MSQPWVLIVDDDEHICKLFETTISLWNIKTKSLTNPLLVTDEIKKKFYNVILLDVFMPERNGIDLLVEIHQSCPDTKIIVITGYADKDIAIKALSLGACDFLEKPMAIDLLHHVVKRALDTQRTEIEHRQTLAEFGKKSQELLETIEALSVLMKNIDRAKQEMGKMIVMQFRSLLVPIIENLQNEKDAAVYKSQLAMLSNYIENLTVDLSTGQQTNSSSLALLSLRELQIALMIKNYMTNEEIAARLHISPETVRTHRRNIRKKLGMKGTKARLNVHLLALQGNALGVDISGQIDTSSLM
jgi:FixJ family two-component response regulator